MRALAAAGLLGAALVFCAGCGGGRSVPPNLLLIVVDTLRADHTTPQGYPRDTTPALERLASEGVRVEVAYAPTATTGPTHAALFTGRYPRSVGVRRNAVVLAAEHTTLAERLAAAGWETAAVVSSFVLHRKFGFDQGFASYDDDFDPRGATLHERSYEGHAVPRGFDRRATETSDRALAWLDARAADAPPFFLFLHYFDPHGPYVAPIEYQRRFPYPEHGSPREKALAIYDAEVAYTDAEIGRVLAGLAERRLAANTFVVVTADHGEGLFDHGYLFHDVHLYEEAVRVPLLFRGPGLPPGRVLAGPVLLLDLLPTLLDLLGAPAPDVALPGRSLVAALRGEEELDPDRELVLERRIFSSHRVGNIRVEGEKLAIRKRRWKYSEAPEEAARALYDLARDPGERRNLVDRDPERAAELAASLAAWRRRTPAAAQPGEVAPEDRAHLEALGYAD